VLRSSLSGIQFLGGALIGLSIWLVNREPARDRPAAD